MNSKQIKKIAIEIGTIALFAMTVIPMIAGAQIPNTAPITSLGGAQTTITNIVNFMITLFWIIVVGFLIWAAVTYLTAQGDEEKVGTAKKRLVYALIAAAIALLSTGIQAIVTSLLQGR